MRILLRFPVSGFGKAWKDKSSALFRTYYRFLIPLFIVLCAKLVGGFFLFHLLNMGSSDTYWMTVKDSLKQNEFIGSGASQGVRWPYLFLGWDSAWYLTIVQRGYAFYNQSYAFFPGFPFFSWLFNLFFQNSFYALAVFSFITGNLWIPIYQLVAENYVDSSKALKSTLFYAFFPYVFLFTTVAYSEGLFLFSTLSAWYFFKKRRRLFSALFAAIAAISRPVGLLIVLPILIEEIRTYTQDIKSLRLRNVFYLSIPFQSFFVWLFYCKITFGDWFAFANRSAWNPMYSFRVLIFNVLPAKGLEALLDKFFKDFQVWPFSFAWVIFVLIVPFMIYALIGMDVALTLYSVVYFCGILVIGGLESIPRFISFIYPIWLPPASKLFQNKRSSELTLIICASFYLVGIFFWYSFLNGIFVS